MITAATRLDAALRAVCPAIDGVSVGDWFDRATWRVDYASEATPEQRQAAEAVLAVFVPAAATGDDLLAAKRRVAELADAFAVAVHGPVPDIERASWATKEIAARAFLAGGASTSQIAMLQPEAVLTGETLEVLATKIVANADAYVAIAGRLAGERRLAMAALDALQAPTRDQVTAVLAQFAATLDALLAQIGGSP